MLKLLFFLCFTPLCVVRVAMAMPQRFADAAKANRERATLEICRLIGIPKHEAAAGVGNQAALGVGNQAENSASGVGNQAALGVGKGNNTLSVHKRTTASGVGEVKYRLSQCC